MAMALSGSPLDSVICMSSDSSVGLIIVLVLCGLRHGVPRRLLSGTGTTCSTTAFNISCSSCKIKRFRACHLELVIMLDYLWAYAQAHCRVLRRKCGSLACEVFDIVNLHCVHGINGDDLDNDVADRTQSFNGPTASQSRIGLTVAFSGKLCT